MKFIALTLFLQAAIVAQAATIPKLLRRQTNITEKPTCGTTNDATLSDCRWIYDNWPALPDWGPTCHYSLVHKAWRPACHGNCCIYTDWDGVLWADARLAVQHLLDCGDKGKNTVNGRIKVVNSGNICLSNGDGCGDCFDD